MYKTILYGPPARYLSLLSIVFLLFTGLVSCEKTSLPYENSSNIPPSNYLTTDTLTISMQTVLLDSIVTSGTSVLLAGQHQDTYFGKSTANGFFQLGLPADRTLDERAVYDSMVILLIPDGSLYGDSTFIQQLTLHEVTQPIQLPDNSTVFFNNSQFKTATTPLGTFNGMIYPGRRDTVRINMSSKGAQLFQLLKQKSNEISSQDQFSNYLKGLSIRTGNNNKAIFSFQAGAGQLITRLYYHIDNVLPDPKQMDFPVYKPELTFSQVQTDRNGTLLSALTISNRTLPSTVTGNQGFVQPLSQIATRLDFPTLKTFERYNKFFKLLSATLVIEPVAGTYASAPLPPRLSVCEVNSEHKVTDTLIDPVAGGRQYGNLVIDQLLNINTRYTYDLTPYCMNELKSDNYSSRGILLLPPPGDYRTRFNRLVAGDSKREKNNVKLQLYYMIYN